MINEPVSMLAYKMRKLCASSADEAAVAENVRLLMQSERHACLSRWAGEVNSGSPAWQVAHHKLALIKEE